MTASGDVRLGAQGQWGNRLRGCTITGTRPPERMTRGLPQYDAIVSHDHNIEHVTMHRHIDNYITHILRPQTLPRGRIVLPSPFGENGFPLRVPSLFRGTWKVSARCKAASYSGRLWIAAQRSSTFPLSSSFQVFLY